MGVFAHGLWCCPSFAGCFWCSWLGLGFGLLMGRVWLRAPSACPPPFPVPVCSVGVRAGVWVSAPLLRQDTEPGESAKQVKTQWLAWATKPTKGTTRGLGGGSLVHAHLLGYSPRGGGGDGPGTERLWPLGVWGFLGSHLLDLLPPLHILILQDLVPGHHSRVADPLHLRTTTDTTPEPCTCPPVGRASTEQPHTQSTTCPCALQSHTPPLLAPLPCCADACSTEQKSLHSDRDAYIFHAYMPNSILSGAVGASITNPKFTFPSF